MTNIDLLLFFQFKTLQQISDTLVSANVRMFGLPFSNLLLVSRLIPRLPPKRKKP